MAGSKWVAIERKHLNVLLEIARTRNSTPIGDLTHLISCRACGASWKSYEPGHPDVPCTAIDIEIVPLSETPTKD